jgi:NMD protein affecting ribosome stability and mRNA decay
MNCPTCNRSSDECRFIGDFCEFCATDMAKKKALSSIGIEQCRLCSRIRIRGIYTGMDRDSIRNVIESEMKMPGWNAEVISIRDREAQVRFYYGAEKNIAFEKSVHISITHRTCTDCFRRSSGYFEAIVQLRGTPDKVEKMTEKIGKYLEKGGAFISKIEQLDDGCDMYISSKELIGEFFMQRDLKPKKSFHLYGMRKSRKVYRNTYFLKL